MERLMAAVFFIESQTIDLGVIAKDEMLSLKHQLEGMIGESPMTLELAINNLLMKGR